MALQKVWSNRGCRTGPPTRSVQQNARSGEEVCERGFSGRYRGGECYIGLKPDGVEAAAAAASIRIESTGDSSLAEASAKTSSRWGQARGDEQADCLPLGSARVERGRCGQVKRSKSQELVSAWHTCKSPDDVPPDSDDLPPLPGIVSARQPSAVAVCLSMGDWSRGFRYGERRLAGRVSWR